MANSLKATLRQKIVSAVQAANQDLRDQQQRLQTSIQGLEANSATIIESFGPLQEKLDAAQARIASLEALVRLEYDNIQESTLRLEALRKQPKYQQALADKTPLISIRIATYNRSQTLIDKAITSILKQTYQNYEVIIVGDHCTDDTAEKVAALKNSKITFYNLPTRTVYPEDRIRKWQVIGAPAMNAAAGMAHGTWIAPLDDDDEFNPDHLEKLLQLAQASGSEFVYGAMNQRNLVTHEDAKIWSSPPSYGNISLNGAMYLSLLDGIFKYDFHSYILDAAADWTMVRRMMESGVRISGTDEIIGTLNMIPAGDTKKDY